MKLNIFEKNTYPIKLETCSIEQIKEILGGPSLLHFETTNSQSPLFISTLLHGNETTSFNVLQMLLKEIKNIGRDLIIFIGNVDAASVGLRQLPGQVDYNRIWGEGDSIEHQMAQEVHKYIRGQNVFASIDIHNNTGKNPFYSCVNTLDKSSQKLASLFGDHTVYFKEPQTVQSMLFSKFCTSVTIEAGLPGRKEAAIAVYEFIQKVIKLSDLADIKIDDDRSHVYHSLGRIVIDMDSTVDFDNDIDSKCDFSFIPSLEDNNFEVVYSKTQLGFVKDISKIKVLSDYDDDWTEDFLEVKDGKLLTKRVFIPSMLTHNVTIMKDDCLGYVMEAMIPVSQKP